MERSESDAPRGGRKVAVLGGGVAGLSVAHQLVKWNRAHPDEAYDITVFDSRGRRDRELGGKARSWWKTKDERAMAGEHGFRFFPGFYQHLIATMAEIPDASGERFVSDHLVAQTETTFLARHLPLHTDAAPRRGAKRVADALHQVGPYLTAFWLIVVPMVLALLEVPVGIWIAWLVAMPVRTVLRWIVEAASADGTARHDMPLRSSGAVEEHCHPLVALRRRLPLARWWWVPPMAFVLWWGPPWPVWVAAVAGAAIWTCLPQFMASVWLWREMRGQVPIDVKPRATESLWAALAVVQLVTSCRARVYQQWESTSWWEFIGAWRYSDRFKLTLATGLTRSFVATKAERMSARTGGLVLAQLIYDINPYLTRDNAPDRVLDGPTSDVWLIPWVRFLGQNGVKFNELPPAAGDDGTGGTAQPTTVEHCLVQRLLLDKAGDRVDGFEYRSGSVNGGIPRRQGDPSVAEAFANAPDGHSVGHFDHYVLAVSGTAAQRILGNSADLVRVDRANRAHRPTHPMSAPAPVPFLDGIFELEFGWMTGIVFHLDHIIDLPSGHMLCLDSEWALTAIDQHLVWPRSKNNPEGGTILSVDVSDWFRPSSTGLPALFSDVPDIIEEVWRQLGQHIPELAGLACPPRTRVLVDTAIDDPDTDNGPGVAVEECVVRTDRALPLELENLPLTNSEKLLVNTAGSWKNRPCAVTSIPNLFVAGDYVRTGADFASMESADEAARWAAQAIIASDQTDRRSVPGDPAGFVDPPEFRMLLRAFRAVDRVLYWTGLPNPLMLVATPLGWFAGLEHRFRCQIERRFRTPGLPTRDAVPELSTGQ